MRIRKPGGSVVVVGSLHHDIIVRADRQPLRGETLMGHEWFPKFGGKGGNQAVAAARLGAETHMIGAIGEDSFGDALIAGLDAAGVSRERVSRVATGSGMSVAMVDSEGDYSAIVVTGANAWLDPEEFDQTTIFDRASILLVQNEIPAAVNLAAAQAARRAGAAVLWNAAPMRPDTDALIELVDLLIMNAVEAEQFCGQPVRSLDEAAEAARSICQAGTNTVVTVGAAGCAWATANGDEGSLPAERVENAQAHGAGDVFCGALAAHLVDAPLSVSLSFAAEKARRHVAGLSIQ